MLKTTWVVGVVLMAGVSYAARPKSTTNIFETPSRATPDCPIDKIVFQELLAAEHPPALCSDAVFLRRAYLDVIGTLPTAKEAREFHADPDAKNKRRLLIDRLLERDEFADYWVDEVGRRAADQGRVPRESMAQCGPGLSPLGPQLARRTTSPTTSSPASCSPPAAATSASGRSTSTARSRTGRPRASPGRWP